MKYLVMICRGHLPMWKGRINSDARRFLRYFLPKGTRPDRFGLQKVVRQLHLAFKGLDGEEVYDVLMEQFLAAAAKYDPYYPQKLKQVVEVIEDVLSRSPCFRTAELDRHLEFGSARYLQLLLRRGLLVPLPGQEERI